MTKDVILVIQEDSEELKELEKLSIEGYKIVRGKSEKEGIEIFIQRFSEIVLIILDTELSLLSGYKVLELLQSRNKSVRIPIILTGSKEPDQNRLNYQYGVINYLRRPYPIDFLKQIILNTIRISERQITLENELQARNKEIEELREKLEKGNKTFHGINMEVADTIGSIMEFRDLASGLHTKKVRLYTKCLCEILFSQYPEYSALKEDVSTIELASCFHDIGKSVIPDSVLLKPGRLTTDEFEIMKSHTTRGSDMILTCFTFESKKLEQYCYQIVRHHHERYDGKGYPDGLVGEDIPIEAQAVGLADVYDALVSPRIYKQPSTCEEAYNMIIHGECGVFSEKLLKVFTECKKVFEEIAEKYREED